MSSEDGLELLILSLNLLRAGITQLFGAGWAIALPTEPLPYPQCEVATRTMQGTGPSPGGNDSLGETVLFR